LPISVVVTMPAELAAVSPNQESAASSVDCALRVALFSRVMPTLRSNLTDLAHSFADSVLDAIRSASLEELLGEATSKRGAGRPPKLGPMRSSRSTGRLSRRSLEEITKTLDKVVLLVKTKKDGLRAEEIRAALGMQSKEMPRILKEGLEKKRLKAKGRKRATRYFAA
jgi:hypothetical protein